MGILNIFKRKKASETRENIIGEKFFDSLTKTKELLSEQQAKQIGAVVSSIDFISNVVAMLPIRLYCDSNGKTEEIIKDNRLKLLNDEPGDTLDAYQMKKAFINDYFYKGSGFIFCNKERNIVKSLHYVDKTNISYIKNTNPIFKRCEYTINGKNYQPFQFIRILRNSKDGVSGEPIMNSNSLTQQALYKALEYESTLISSGGIKKGFLKSNTHISQEALNKLQKGWKELFSNNENTMMILNDNLDFKEISNNLVEMQLNENKKTNKEDIYSLFHLTQKAVSGELSTTEFANVLNTAITPFLQEIITAINSTMLLEEEKEQGYYFAFDIKAFLKADTKSRYEAYKIGIDSGVLQIDEARYEEDLPPLGLEFVKLGLQDVLYSPKTNKIYTPNTKTWASLDDVNINNQQNISKD